MNIVDENNKANMITQGTTTVVLSGYYYSVFASMFPFLIVVLPLVTLDIKYGRRKARSRGEEVTIRKTVRMTLDKVFSYLCWIMLSATLALAFGTIAIKIIIMGIVFGVEVASVISNYLYDKGIEISSASAITLVLRLIWYRITGMKENFNNIIIKAEKNGKIKQRGIRKENISGSEGR
jgi:hypothetical protein